MECESPFKRLRPTNKVAPYNGDHKNETDRRYTHHIPSQRQQHLQPHHSSNDNRAFDRALMAFQEAFTSQQRLHSLQQLLNSLGYNPTSRVCHYPLHLWNQIKSPRILSLCCLHLEICLSGSPQPHQEEATDNLSVAEILLRTIDILYKMSCPELMQDTMMQNQGKEVLRLLSLTYQLFRTRFDRDNNIALSIGLSIFSIWHACSSSNLGTSLLLHRLETLPMIHELLHRARHVKSNRHYVSDATVMECLGVLKNLTYYGEDSRCLIVEHSELMSILTSLSGFNGKACERLSAVFRNLALSTEVRFPLVQRTDALTALTYMIGKQYSHIQQVENGTKSTLRNVLSTLSSLAMEANCTNLLLFHGDGIIVRQLKQLLSHPEDAVIRKRSARTIRMLARETASISPIIVLLQEYQLLQVLSFHAIHDTNEGVRTEAQETFAKCATLIRAPQEQYDAVLDTLTAMTNNTIAPNDGTMNGSQKVSADLVTRALRDQASLVENRKAMAQRSELTQGLANILVSSESSACVKENICIVFLDLSKESANHLILTTPTILDALIQTLLETRTIFSTSHNGNRWRSSHSRAQVRETIVRCFLNMLQTPSTWKPMANQISLLQALLQFATHPSTNGPLKKQVKVAILQLASVL